MRHKWFTTEYAIYRDGATDCPQKEHVLEIFYTWIPYDPGVHTLKNGDPGYPPEGGYSEIQEIRIGKKDVYELLTEKEVAEIHDFVDEMHEGRW